MIKQIKCKKIIFSTRKIKNLVISIIVSLKNRFSIVKTFLVIVKNRIKMIFKQWDGMIYLLMMKMNKKKGTAIIKTRIIKIMISQKNTYKEKSKMFGYNSNKKKVMI